MSFVLWAVLAIAGTSSPVMAQADNNVLEIDPVTLQKINVGTVEVVSKPLSRTVRTTGRFEMDESARQSITLKIGGWIEKLHADFDGKIIHEGAPLFDIYSPPLVATQEEYLLALRNAERMRGSAGEAGAKRLLEAARRRLEYWDLTSEQIEQIGERGEPQRTLTFFAPISGEVMHKSVDQGQHVEAGQTLMKIVDISKVWLIVDVYEQDLAWVKPGAKARIEVPAQPGEVFRGQVDYIYHMMNSELRTARARIVLPGRHGGPLKPGMYATAYLEGGSKEPTPVVPENAVIRTGQREIVIVALGEGRFRPQQVNLGHTSDSMVQVLGGLEAGERVVTSAQFLLDSEAQLRGVVAAIAAEETNR